MGIKRRKVVFETVKLVLNDQTMTPSNVQDVKSKSP